MKQIRMAALLICLIGPGFSLPADAASIGTYSFLKNTPAQLFNDEDWAIFNQTLNTALEESSDGETKNWENSNTKVSGEITIIRSVKNAENDCREVKITNQAKDRKRTSKAIFCKQADGSWKVYNGPKKPAKP